MGRPTPVWQLTKQLAYAQKRAAYLARTDRTVKSSRDAAPRKLISYTPLFLKVGTTYPKLKINASEAAITEFGLTNLGLTDSSTDLAASQSPPRGFRPSMVHMVKGDATPSVQTAAGSGARYIKYSASTAGAAQASYSAPVSAGNSTPTVDEVETKVAAIATAKKTAIGDYGSIRLVLESYPSTFG
jgi:hypothetical protein